MTAPISAAASADRRLRLPPFSRQDRVDLLKLHRRNQVSHLLDEVPKPRRSVPFNAPPDWCQLSLDKLLPMYERPYDSAIQFSRQRLGRELFATAGADFDLSDPYCQTVSFEYQPLHDHNLRRVYMRSRYMRRFRQHRMITADAEVICSLRQFNEYRRYLKRLYIQKVNRVRVANDEAIDDERNFQRAELANRRYAVLCQRHEKVAENREKFRQAVREAADNRHAQAAQLMAKYRATLQRFADLQAQKQRAAGDRMRLKEQAAEGRRQLKFLEAKRRVILMHRKFATEAALVRSRLRLQRVRRKRRHQEEVKDRWVARENFNAERRSKDAHLLALAEERDAYQVMVRSRAVAESFERDQQMITKRRAQLIVDRYPGRAREDLVRTLQAAVRRLVVREQRELEEKAKSSASTVEEEEEKVVVVVDADAKVPSSPKTSQLSQPSTVKKASSNKTLRSRTSSARTNRSLASRKTILSPAASKGGLRSDGSVVAAPLKPLTMPFEPQHLSAVGLVDSVQGYGKLTDRDIRMAVESAYDCMQQLGEQINGSLVIDRANRIMLRICKGYTGDLPRDEAVMVCVRQKVEEMLERVQQKPILLVQEALAARIEEEAACCPKKRKSENVRVRHPCELSLKFGHTYVVNKSAYAEDIETVRPSGEWVATKQADLKRMVNTCLQTPEADRDMENPEIPADMQTRPLAHLYVFQKYMILNNLERFESTLNEKIEQRLVTRFNFATLQMLKPGSGQQVRADQMEELTAKTVDSVLTLPEKDAQFAARILLATRWLSVEIMRRLEGLMEDEQRRIEERRASAESKRFLC